MKTKPWVTGPAVEIIVSLNGLEVGDEVKVKPHPDNVKGGVKDWVFGQLRIRVAKVVELEWDCPSNLPIRVATKSDDLNEVEWMYRNNIVAWRRP